MKNHRKTKVKSFYFTILLYVFVNLIERHMEGKRYSMYKSICKIYVLSFHSGKCFPFDSMKNPELTVLYGILLNFNAIVYVFSFYG